jgi:hypothetical protein
LAGRTNRRRRTGHNPLVHAPLGAGASFDWAGWSGRHNRFFRGENTSVLAAHMECTLIPIRIDDNRLTLGSANLNEHELFNDTEMNLVSHDHDLARQTRLRLWAEHLELAVEHIPSDPIQAIDTSGNQSAKNNSGTETPAKAEAQRDHATAGSTKQGAQPHQHPPAMEQDHPSECPPAPTSSFGRTSRGRRRAMPTTALIRSSADNNRTRLEPAFPVAPTTTTRMPPAPTRDTLPGRRMGPPNPTDTLLFATALGCGAARYPGHPARPSQTANV